MNGLTYTKVGDYYLPNLLLKEQMKWVGLANNCKAQAEEIILHELIYDGI